MSKAVKKMVMDELTRRLDGARDVLVVDVSKMTALATNKLRLTLRKKDIRILGVKNTLARHALGDAGAALSPYLKGPSAIVFGGEDVVALSREIQDWADKIQEFNIKGAVVEGPSLDAEGVKALSKSPSREELISRIAGQILAPGANLAAAMLGPGATLASQLKSKADEEGGEAADAPAA